MMCGKKKEAVNLYTQDVVPLDTQWHQIGSYNGMSSIISNDCTSTGIHLGLDGDNVCDACRILYKERGSSNPGTILNKWYTSLSRCNERRHKDVLSSISLDDARKCCTTSVRYLMSVGIELIEEAKAQVEYSSYKKKLGNDLPNETYKTFG
eukprot:3743766-Ditylum_brightwellii.AAC.1